ncbi:MAG: hypothetical protein ACTSSL_09955 [Candidatus Heimdallarchaeaceae archaeon]|uniref:Uncharacterized protein n=1 Tax=Candidatus Heimdallarchaeum endolithica TaxID=2876572 RepID=A0A9Y1FMW3_9ARCH|nr:MAG: hypothetical protein K9W46_10685 [Candidatus Heimdallarchaeum endolithica]
MMGKIEKKELSEFIENTIEQLDIDFINIFEDEQFSFFNTDFGKKFESNCKDLLGFIAIAYSPQVIPVLIQAYNYFLNNIEKITETMEIEQKEDMLKLLTLLNANKEEKKIKQDSTLSKTLKHINLIPRLIAYLILTQYAYIDTFLGESYDYMCKKAQREIIPDISKEFHKSSIKERPNRLMKVLDERLPKIISDAYRKLNKANNKTAFLGIIKLRNEIAHAKPLVEINKLKKKFPKQLQKAENTLLELRKKTVDEIEPKTEWEKDMLSIGEKVLTEFKMLFFIVEISLSTMKYLALFERILTYFFDSNK